MKKGVNLLREPIVITSLRWDGWLDGWTISVETRDQGITIALRSARGLLKRLAWWLEPATHQQGGHQP